MIENINITFKSVLFFMTMFFCYYFGESLIYNLICFISGIHNYKNLNISINPKDFIFFGFILFIIFMDIFFKTNKELQI